MTNAYYNPNSVPAPNSTPNSAVIRAEFAALGAAFDKLAPLSGNALRLVQINAAGSGQQPVSDFTVAQVKTMLDGPGVGIFGGPIQVPTTAALSGIVGGLVSDAFTTDTDKVIANYGLSFKVFSSSPSAATMVLSSYGGMRFYVGGAERARLLAGYLDMSAPLMCRVTPGLNGIIAAEPSDTFYVDTDKAIHHYGLSWKAFTDAAAGPAAALSGYGGVRIFTGGAERLRVDEAGVLTPRTDNTQALGSGGLRFSVLYAGSGTINTSDAREKTAVAALTAGEIAAAKALAAEIGTFRFLAAVAAKGPAARRHVGMTVQRAIEVMAAHGLDPMAYGFICHDFWGATQGRAAGDRYSFRPDEMLSFIVRGLNARLTALETA